MAHYPDLHILTDLLGIPYEDALRAMEQTGGDAHAAADIAFGKQEKRRSTTNTRAGPSNSIPTPPSSSPLETSAIEADDEEDASDHDGDEDDLYSPPSPIPTPDLWYDDPTADPVSDDDFEKFEERAFIPRRSPQAPAPQPPALRRTTASGDQDKSKGKASAIVQSPPVLTHDSCQADDYTSDDEHTTPQCVCQEPNNINMIQCTTCQGWFHYECAHLTPATIPDGPWYCHFEVNSSKPALNRRGQKFNEFESRALYLSVKHCAPLGRHFWDKVCSYLASQFNVERATTSAKLEWLRNSSAIWGFDERDCTQYSAEQMDKRKGLFRCQLEGRVIPPRIHFRAIGAGIHPAETATEVDIAERVGLRAPKPINPQQQLVPVPKQPRKQKRKRVVLEDSEIEDDVVVVQARAPKRARTVAAPRPTGGKYVNGFDANGTPAPAPVPRPVSRPDPVVDAGAPILAATGPSSIHAPVLTDTFILTDDEDENDDENVEVTNTAEDPSTTTNTPVQDLFSNSLALINPIDGPVDYWCCNYGPPPPFQSRFDALAEHRRYVKEMLKDIEPNLDWYEGPWHGANELLWTGDEENQLRYMPEASDN